MNELRFENGKMYLDDLELASVKEYKVISSANQITELTVTMCVDFNQSVTEISQLEVADDIHKNSSSITKTQSAIESVVKNEEKGFRLLQTAEHIVFHSYPIIVKKQTVEPEEMTISKLYEAGIIKDDTEITVRNSHFVIVAVGNWFNDNIQDYINKELESFSWQDDNKVYADQKEVCEKNDF